MKHKRHIIPIVLVLVLAMLLSACGTGQQEPAESGVQATDSGSGTGVSTGARTDLIIGLSTDILSLDPQAGLSNNDFNVHMQIYGTLLKYDENAQIVPYLAEDFEISDDELVWTFRLKQGVLFSNGEELTADDVVFTFDRLSQNTSFAGVFSYIDGYSAADEYTFELRLNKPYFILQYLLADSKYAILNREAVESGGENWSDNPVGTGPYKLQEWSSGEEIVLVRNEAYNYAELPPIETIHFKIITDTNTMAVALQSGDIDFVGGTGIAASLVSQFANNPDYTVLSSANSSYEFLNLNTQRAPFDNVLVRQAIAHAIDKDSIILMAAEGNGVRADTQLVDGVFGYDQAIEGYEYDTERAKELLAEAGYPDGFDMTIYTVGARINVCEIIQSQLAEVGINVSCEPVDLGAFLATMSSGDYDANMMGLGLSYPEGESLLNPMFQSSSAYNWCGFTSAEIDELILAVQSSGDDEYRQECYSRLLTILRDECPQIPLYYSMTNMTFDSSLDVPYVPVLNLYRVEDMSWKS